MGLYLYYLLLVVLAGLLPYGLSAGCVALSRMHFRMQRGEAAGYVGWRSWTLLVGTPAFALLASALAFFAPGGLTTSVWGLFLLFTYGGPALVASLLFGLGIGYSSGHAWWLYRDTLEEPGRLLPVMQLHAS